MLSGTQTTSLADKLKSLLQIDGKSLRVIKHVASARLIKLEQNMS